MSLWIIAWSGAKPFRLCDEQKTHVHYTSYEERTLAANAMTSAVTAALTATSIILAVCAAAIALYKERDQFPPESKQNFKASGFFGIFSIAFGVFNLAYIPAQVNTSNVASLWLINLLATLQLLATFFSALRLLLAIRKIF
jgi:uncharacterized membrane protein HdeD (DUF308 family)